MSVLGGLHQKGNHQSQARAEGCQRTAHSEMGLGQTTTGFFFNTYPGLMDYTTKARKAKFEHTETRKRRPFLLVSSFHNSVLLKLKIVLTVKDKCLQSPVFYYRADN